MKEVPVIKDLFNASWISAAVAGGLAFMVIDIQQDAGASTLVYSLFVSVRFFLQGMINLAILAYYMNLRKGALDRSRRLSGYILSYTLAFLWAFCCSPIEIILSRVVSRGTPSSQLLSTFVQSLLNNSLVWTAHTFVILRHEKLGAQMENARLRAAHLEATNLLLRQQMRPHFLFNALNILKSLYKTDTAAGEEYLLHLVNFLRASLGDPETKLIPLSREIRICMDYLEMQRIRFDSALVYSIDIPSDMGAEGCVPPFSLQSLVENAIKHNELTEDAPLRISIFCEEGRVVTANNLQLRLHPESPASGRGLVNLAERYKFISGDQLIIRQDPSQFSVSIKILSNENCHHRG